MKAVILAIAVFAACALSVKVDQNDMEKALFADYMHTYSKQYASQEEFDLRFNNFKASLARSIEKNAKSKATYGITKFSDLSPAEFKSSVLMTKGIKPSTEKREVVSAQVDTAPPTLDWRTKGAVTPVKNQEQCGSCWAFSATESIESAIIVAGKGTNSTVDFAPQQIVDCDTSDYGCEGGNPYTAFEYIIGAGGIESESAYPYTAETQSCKFNKNDIAGKISSWKYATTSGDETTLQNNLIAMGPLSICVDAEAWQDYQSGVMSWYDCAIFNELDHCVQLVGYNAAASDNSYWIVRNSWGNDWGVDGFIWLEMWEDTCGLTYEATYAIV